MMAARTTADKKLPGELVIACGNTTKVLEATERSFDPPAIAVLAHRAGADVCANVGLE
jgi:hypothetical protein